MQTFIQKIIVPIDFSEASEAAARYAATLARTVGASVHLIHVLDEVPLAPAPLEFYAGESEPAREARYQAASTRLTSLAASLSANATRVTSEVRSGATADRIGEAVIDYGADLVVMSTHGRTGLSHLLLGSVAERLIRTARCPVLAIRGSARVPETLEQQAEMADVCSCDLAAPVR
jgi:universal stress protein A